MLEKIYPCSCEQCLVVYVVLRQMICFWLLKCPLARAQQVRQLTNTDRTVVVAVRCFGVHMNVGSLDLHGCSSFQDFVRIGALRRRLYTTQADFLVNLLQDYQEQVRFVGVG